MPLAVFATSAATPWLRSAYECAPAGTSIVLVGPREAAVSLRLAEPQPLAQPAFQVGHDEVLVVTHPEVPIGALTRPEAQAIFAGQIRSWSEVGGPDLPVMVWVYSSTTDIQQFFDQSIMLGRPPSSNARLAVSVQHMSDSVASNPGSIGLLPRRWKTGNTTALLAVGDVPVLALAAETPQGALADLLACMQSGE